MRFVSLTLYHSHFPAPKTNEAVLKILFTGGTGLIGAAFISKFAHKYEFTVISRHPEKAREQLPKGVDVIAGLHDVADLCLFDAVINLAGEPIADKRWTALQKQRICQSRWDITQHLVTRLKGCTHPPSVFISGSAIGFYGRQGNRPVTESNYNVHDEFTHQVCHRWEQIAMQASSDATRVCVLRTGVVLDKDKGALPKMAMPVKFGVGGKIGSGEQILSWIHIDDMVNAIEYLLSNNRCEGAYNLTAPEPETNAAFTQKLASTLHRPNIFTVPKFALKIMMGEAAEMVTTGQHVIPEKLLDSGFKFTFPTLKPALENIYQ